MTDGLDRLQQDGRSGLADLYRRYSAWLTARVAHRFGADQAEDLAQEAWLRIAPYEARGEIRNPKALLLRIASNLAIDAGRRQAGREADLKDGGSDAAGDPALQAERLLLKQVILSLPQPLRELGIRDRSDPAENLDGGADYLARQIARFGDVRLALAAFNAGPGRVARLGRIPDIRETRAYVGQVVDCYLALSAGRTVRSARDCGTPGAGR